MKSDSIRGSVAEVIIAWPQASFCRGVWGLMHEGDRRNVGLGCAWIEHSGFECLSESLGGMVMI